MTASLFWISRSGPGRLAIAARPRGGDWLSDEVLAWRDQGIDVVVSLLTSAEECELDIAEEESASRRYGLEFIRFPIRDRGIPESREAVLSMAQRLASYLQEGKVIVIHCRAGIGRSTILAASVLIVLGQSSSAAMEQIAAARHVPVPDTAEQKEWIERFAHSLTPTVQPA